MENILQHPVIFAILVMCIATPLTEIPLTERLTGILDEQSASYLTGILEQGGVSLLLYALISWLGMKREAGFTRPSEWRQLWLIWPMLFFSFLNIDERIFDGSITFDFSNPWLPILFILLYLSVGFIEEMLFRSVILPLMLRKWGHTQKGIYLAVMLSSVIFGLLHLLNVIMGRRTLLATGTQIIYGLFFGVFFTACFLRNRSIWPVILTHALFDLCGDLTELTTANNFGAIPQTDPQGALLVIAITLPLLLYGLFIFRKVKPQELPGNQVSLTEAI